MKKLQDAFSDCNGELINGSMIYTDVLPNSADGIDKSVKKHMLLRYLEGTITKEEHDLNSDVFDIKRLYDKYIFAYKDFRKYDIAIDPQDADKLIELRLLGAKTSRYLEILDKLMFILYFENKDAETRNSENRNSEYNNDENKNDEIRKKLYGLVLKMQDKYDWSQDYIREHASEVDDLIFINDSDNYKKCYGYIEVGCELQNDLANNIINYDSCANDSSVNDWILGNKWRLINGAETSVVN